MQLRSHIVFLIWGVIFPFLLPGAENLLPEWEKSVDAEKKILLPGWNFNDWGRRSTARIPVIRKHRFTSIDGKGAIVLESSPGRRNINMAYRRVSIPAAAGKRYRFTVTFRSGNRNTPLVCLRMIGSNKGYSRAEGFFSPDSQWRTESIELTTAKENKSLNLYMILCGSGSVTITGCRLEDITPVKVPAAELRFKTSGNPVILHKRTPADIIFSLPAGTHIPENAKIRITLPWGIRLLNMHPGKLTAVSVKPRKEVIYEISGFRNNYKYRNLLLAMGTDLQGFAATFSGSIVMEQGTVPAIPELFDIRISGDIEAVPPRRFIIGLPGSRMLSSADAAYDSELARLRSGANVFTGTYIGIPQTRIRRARIAHWPFFNLPQVKGKGPCRYAKLRDESFWEKHFLPQLRRNVLRYAKDASILLCDSRLGQGKAIDCLCSLCRAEFADFAPSLPRRNVMNYSNGLLISRYSKELRRFRNARLNVLREAAGLYLPVGSNGFNRRPHMLPMFSLYTSFSKDTLDDLSSAAVNFGEGLRLPDGEKYNAAVNFTFLRQLRDNCRKAQPKCRIFMRITPRIRNISPGALQFEILNTVINSYSGVLIEMPSYTPVPYFQAVAESAGVIREYERFFLRGELQKHHWRLDSADLVRIPPVPDGSNFPLELPDKMPALLLKVWKSGGDTLVGIGNFSGEVKQGTFTCSRVPLTWRGEIDDTAVDLRTLKHGVSISVPGHSWRFFRLSGI